MANEFSNLFIEEHWRATAGFFRESMVPTGARNLVKSFPAAPQYVPRPCSDASGGSAQSERARILAALEAIKPGEQPYTKGSWEMVRKAEMRLWERMRDAIGG